MRAPSPTLVVDAAILIAAARGRGAAILVASERLALVTTDRVLEESSRRISLGMKRPELLPVLFSLSEIIEIVPVASLSNLDAARRALRDGVASGNGSTDDAHVLALAWNADADIWSADRDFAGTGVASWSTANLLHALRHNQR